MVHDVSLLAWNGQEMLEINEVLPSAFTPDVEARERLNNSVKVEQLVKNRTEQTKLSSLLHSYGWLNGLRIGREPQSPRKCRWMCVGLSSRQLGPVI